MDLLRHRENGRTKSQRVFIQGGKGDPPHKLHVSRGHPQHAVEPTAIATPLPKEDATVRKGDPSESTSSPLESELGGTPRLTIQGRSKSSMSSIPPGRRLLGGRRRRWQRWGQGPVRARGPHIQNPPRQGRRSHAVDLEEPRKGGAGR